MKASENQPNRFAECSRESQPSPFQKAKAYNELFASCFRIVYVAEGLCSTDVMKLKLFRHVRAVSTRLRVVPLSLSPSCLMRKKTAKKNGRVKSWAREACFFFRGSFASRTMDYAKEGPLVVSCLK